MKSKGGNFVVKYCMNLSDEKKETAIKIALESKGNVRKRKIAVPLLMILGIVIIFSSIFLIINSPAILWYIYMVLGIVCLLLAFNAKSFQKFVLKKAELLLDKSFRTGIVEYHFDAEGIETISQMGYSKNYWTAFKEYGTMGQYIFFEASNPVPTPLLGHRCRSSQEITGSPTPFSTSNHYLWICASASFSLSNPNIAA